MRRSTPLFALTALLLGAPLLRAQDEIHDPHSFSRPDEVAATHLELSLEVDFAERRLEGEASWSFERRNGGAEELLLDTRDLDILGVRFDDEPTEVPYRLGDADPILGRSLTIPLGPETHQVRIRYRTRPEAAALQWLEPAQTAGGRAPFLFSQSESILARTWVPCQDTPSVRFTYDARLRVPPNLLALMSAENPRTRSADGRYRFRMKQPIPSYLLALAVGDLEFRRLGPRTGVYGEPSVVESAAWEFADTEAMMTAAEKLLGPYRWGRYDLLVLPPSFPYGGMENPRLTFATPTLIAGDRSLVGTVAHELAHSWSGNLVTNATWNDFWLNEGFTTYFEHRLLEALYGRDASETSIALGRQELDEYLREPGVRPRDSWLFQDLASRDPDDVPGAIAYEKGSLFLHTLEEAAGRKRWDAFLRRYFDANAFHPMTTHRFLDLLRAELGADSSSIFDRVDPESWAFAPGVPTGAYVPHSAALAAADQELQRYLAGAPASGLVTAGWNSAQWVRFVRGLDGVDATHLGELDAAFALTRSANSELLALWLEQAARARYDPAMPALESFVARVGRLRLVRPIYAALAGTPDGAAKARALFARVEATYHPVTRATLAALLGIKR
jgi:aminopeptidase N